MNLECDPKDGDEIIVDMQNSVPHAASTKVLCNLNASPLPLAEDSVDMVQSKNCFEFVNDLFALLCEVHRVLKPGGLLEVIVPHASAVDICRDADYKTLFHFGSFDNYVNRMNSVELSNGQFQCVEKKLLFENGLKSNIGKLIYKMSAKKYERHYCWTFPCRNVFTRLKVLKEQNVNESHLSN